MNLRWLGPLLLATAPLFFGEAVLAVPIDAGDFNHCAKRHLILELVPNIESQQGQVSKTVARFIRSLEGDRSLPTEAPVRQDDPHFAKHRQEFERAGFLFRTESDYIRSAIGFARATGGNRIVFKSKSGQKLFKVDLSDHRVLIASPDGRRLISYYVLDPRRFGYHTLAQQIVEALYLAN